ncbi:head-tail adaptor protein [Oceaniglobus ichthyenteri]|uniref:head-tail adaptor protein n=1 Tax=Oceaniglobus ichthyenteri TaxID=2136177 RepID=UPI000D34ABA2|nr:head-tail adaptor protein [Oceaniglobus ichthyenteri]
MSGVQLSRKLVLEHQVEVPDGAGGFSRNWTALGTLWADLRVGSGRARSGQEVALSRVTYRITVRGAAQGAPSRPAPGQRFVDGTRVFSIDAVTEVVPRGAYLICYAHEEVAL